jgi:hypothetical protein
MSNEPDNMNLEQQLSAIKEQRASMEARPVDELIREFQAGLRLNREHLIRMASLLAQIESKGRSVSGDKNWLRLYRDVASGRLLADAVIRFGPRGHTLDSIRSREPQEQRRLLEMQPREAEEELRRSQRERAARRANLDEMLAFARTATAPNLVDAVVAMLQASRDPAATVEPLRKELVRVKKLPPRDGRQAS